MSERRSFLRAAGLVGAITVLSRFLGLFRDIVLASCFGASRAGDIFLLAFELPNLTRRILGEGSLSAFIVPIFSRVRAEEGPAGGWRFASNALTTIGLFTLLLMALGMLAAEPLFSLFGYGYVARGDFEAVRFGAELTRLMFPFQVLLALSAILMGLCHSLRHFATPALGSVMLNLAMIAVGLLMQGRTTQEGLARWMAAAVLVGALLRLAIMLPPLRRRGFRFQWRLKPDSPRMRELYLMMLPALFGMAVVQINISISRAFATSLGEGFVPCLMFANHLVQMPLAIIASALGTAILPQLAALVIEDRRQELRRLVSFAFRLVLLLFMPATVGLMVLGRPIVQVLFQRHQWDALATENARWALLFYAPALIFWGALQIITPLFYARKDVRTPVLAGAAAMAVNVVLNILLVTVRPLREGLGHGGLALANTIGVIVNNALLQIVLGRQGLRLWDRQTLSTLWKTFLASLAMALACHLLWPPCAALAGGSAVLGAALLGLDIALGIGVYFACASLLRTPDLNDALLLLVRKARPRANPRKEA